MVSSSQKFSIGVVLGKFMPPHHGHRLVIATALAQSNRVVLVVCQQASDPIPAQQRVEWLRQLYPTATVRILEVTFPVTDELAWASRTERAVGERPAAVFSSEGYGRRLAELWHCAHVLVDQERKQYPISASQILQDPHHNQQYLDPIVYRYFVLPPGSGASGSAATGQD